MPLRDIKEPPKEPKGKKDKPSGESTPTDTNSPWQIKDGKKVRKGRKLPFENELHGFFIELSGAVAMADSFSANAIEIKSEELAYGYAKLAKDDPRVKAFFDKLVSGTAISAALIPTLTLVAMIGWHFGFIPPKLGVPITLANGMLPFTREEEKKMKAQQAEEQARAAAGGGNGDSSKT